MRTYLMEFMESYDYPREAIDTLLSAFDVLGKNDDFQSLLNIYDNDRFCDYKALIAKCKDIAADTGIHTYTVEFVMFLCFSRKLREIYLENGYSEAMWWHSMLDLKCKLIVCKSVKNIWGLFVSFWYDGWFRLERFAMGRMQFELLDFPFDYYEKDGKVLRKGDKVINVHIAKTGESIAPELLEDAYRQATEFFKDEFQDKPIPFFCESWLAYPKLDDFLKEGSNIKAFKDRFDIIHVHLYDKGDYSEMWRLYDMDYTGNLDDFPGDSSLRRAYKQYLKEGGQVGEGYGVFFWQGSK